MPKLEVRLDPPATLAQRDEYRDVIDPVRVQVLQLDPVVVQQPAEEAVRGHREPALMEVGKGDDVAVRQRRRILKLRHLPLVHRRLPTQEATLDEALQPLVVDVGATLRHHRHEGGGSWSGA